MRPRISVFIATSLDGFIARSNGDIDWLDAANQTIPPGEDCGYGELMKSVDHLVMGRNSFEKVLTFGDWPYTDVSATILSSRSITFPDSIPENVCHSSDSPQELCQQLSAQGFKHVYVDGGLTIQRFLSEGLVDDITVTLIPIIIGSGIPLFGPVETDISLKCVSTKAYDFGLVQLKYTVNSS